MLKRVSRALDHLENHPGAPRWILLLVLALVWANYLSTGRWAHVPGALHGPKQWWFVAVLVLATLALLVRGRAVPSGPWLSRLVLAAGLIVLVCSVFVWFPPGTWGQIPYLDNWPARYQSTMDALDLYRHGVAAGWNWFFLGGYHSSSDLTVTLGALAWLPVSLFGPAVGFHLLHFILLLALPLLVWIDLKVGHEQADVRNLATGLTGLTVASWFGFFLARSGDTNSLAGTVCTIAALAGSHAAAHGRRWGAVLLVLALVLVNYSHAGFFLYTLVLLAAESLLYRDRRRAVRSALAAAVGVVAALPLTFESWVYPQYFTFNNVTLESIPFAWGPFLRKLYYNVEILFLPSRWFNDFSGVTAVLLPLLLFLALKWRRHVPVVIERPAFHACAALLVIALVRLNTPEFGYAFLRPVHLLVVFPVVALAGVLGHYLPAWRQRGALVLLVGVYLQYFWIGVPHVPDTRTFEPELVAYVKSTSGNMVLFENTFHRDMDVDPSRQSEPTPFAAHVEGLLPVATGKRLYAGAWDGWQWSPFRHQLLSGGAFQGKPIAETSYPSFVAEMRRWGVADLVVWSRDARAYLAGSNAFTQRWQHGPWVGYTLNDADPRAVEAARGEGVLTDLTQLGARLQLRGVRRGDELTVRTNFHPAWRATSNGQTVALFAKAGQMALRAPCDGDCEILLEYPRRRWLTVLAVLATIAGVLTTPLMVGRRV